MPPSRDPTALRVARARPPRPAHERMVKTQDEEIHPVWNARFETLVRQGLVEPLSGSVLQLGCGTGGLTAELLRRHQGPGRVVALDPAAALLDEARLRLTDIGSGKLPGKLFLRLQDRRSKLPFAEETFDTTLSHPGPGESQLATGDWEAQLAELIRVTVPGGLVLVTRALAESFSEVLDVLDEVLVEAYNSPARARLAAHRRALPSGPALADAAERCGLTDVEVVVDRWELLFRSGRELFYAPVIEQGPLPVWKTLVSPPGETAPGERRERDDQVLSVFAACKDAIDTYASGRAFAVTVAGARIIGRKAAEVTAV
jgi:ubiquinone/menaquinone biosynthesis C-methylase UbiE